MLYFNSTIQLVRYLEDYCTINAMEELSSSIDHQNAAILMGHSVVSIPDSTSASPLNRQPHPEKDFPKQYEGQAGATENYIEALIPTAKEENEPKSMEKSFADDLDQYMPKDSILRRSIRERRPDGLLIDEHYASGCKIDRLSLSFLEGVRADATLMSGTALIIQDINQDWAQVLLSKFPRSIHSAFLAEHMIRIDSALATDEAIEQLRKDISKSSPGTKLTYGMTKRRKTTEFEFPRRSSEDNGLHLDILFETNKYSPIPSEIPFSDGPRRDVFEKDSSNHWRRASTRLSWCQLEENFCKI